MGSATLTQPKSTDALLSDGFAQLAHASRWRILVDVAAVRRGQVGELDRVGTGGRAVDVRDCRDGKLACETERVEEFEHAFGSALTLLTNERSVSKAVKGKGRRR